MRNDAQTTKLGAQLIRNSKRKHFLWQHLFWRCVVCKNQS